MGALNLLVTKILMISRHHLLFFQSLNNLKTKTWYGESFKVLLLVEYLKYSRLGFLSSQNDKW